MKTIDVKSAIVDSVFSAYDSSVDPTKRHSFAFYVFRTIEGPISFLVRSKVHALIKESIFLHIMDHK